MSVHAHYSSAALVIRMVGQYSTSDVRSAFLGAFPHATASSRGLVFDVTESDALASRPTQDLRDMAYFLASHGTRFSGRLALVAQRALEYGLMRMTGSEAEHLGMVVHVFRNVTDAKAWIVSGGA